jgi:hypothetical protein
MDQRGNTLSVVLRQAWDGSTLGTLTRAHSMRASDTHVSVIGHITAEELAHELDDTDTANGFANRFLWVCAQRSKLLPRGGNITSVDWEPMVKDLRDALEWAHGHPRRIDFDTRAGQQWDLVYERLTETADGAGLFGAATSRAEAQVRRLALIYAVLDRSRHVRLHHLRAALAVWIYGRASARYLFGHRTGNADAERILTALVAAGSERMSRVVTEPSPPRLPYTDRRRTSALSPWPAEPDELHN